MTREQRDQDKVGTNPTTYPPTPGDRNEEERAKRGFGKPSEDSDTEEELGRREDAKERKAQSESEGRDKNRA